MKKAHVWLALCLLLALAAMGNVPAAQVAPENSLLAGEGLEAGTAGFMDALNVEDYGEIFKGLASWKQNAVMLTHERLLKRIADGGFTEESLKALLEKQDPSGSLGIKTLEQLKAAEPGQVLALTSGLCLVLGGEYRKRKQLKWYVTERNVGLMFGAAPEVQMTPWGGMVRYENSAGDSFLFTLSVEKQAWRITNFVARVGSTSAYLGSALNQQIGGPRSWTEEQMARTREGQQLLQSARDYCRVQYAKTGAAADVTKPFNKEIATGSYDGNFYKVKEYIKELPGSSYDAALVAHPVNANDPWLLLQFKWASGVSELVQCDDQNALNEKIRELTEAEDE